MMSCWRRSGALAEMATDPPNMVTLLRAFCRKCCRTAETADMANAVLICSSSPPVAAPEVFLEIERSSGRGCCWARGRLSDGRDFDAPDVDVNLVGLALRWLGAAAGFGCGGSGGCRGRQRLARLESGRGLLSSGDQRLVRTERGRLICGCLFLGFKS